MILRSSSPALPSDDERPAGLRLQFADIYEDHFSFVWQNARRLGASEASVDDVVQEVFLVAHRKLKEFEGRSSVRTWLYSILVRVIRTFRRRELRHCHDPIDESAIEDRSETAPELLARKQAAATLERLLDEIDEDPRAVFVLVEFHQTSVTEVAEALELNLNTAYTRLRTARQQFQDAVRRHQSRGGAPAAKGTP